MDTTRLYEAYEAALQRGLSQAHIARAIGVDPSTLRKYRESKGELLGVGTRKLLADYLQSLGASATGLGLFYHIARRLRTVLELIEDPDVSPEIKYRSLESFVRDFEIGRTRAESGMQRGE